MSTVYLTKVCRTTFVYCAIPVFLLAWFYFYATAVDTKDWWIENILVFLFIGILFFARNRFVFSGRSMFYIFCFLFLHIYGAKMAYTQNDLGELLRGRFQLSRNPYDRIVHFSFGFLMAYPMTELFHRKFKSTGIELHLAVTTAILSLAAIFELIEWGVAACSTTATGETYVATQGDPWDAQKDIILALIGSILMSVFISFRSKKQKRKFTAATLLIFFCGSYVSAQDFSQPKYVVHQFASLTPSKEHKEITGIAFGLNAHRSMAWIDSSGTWEDTAYLKISGVNLELGPIGIVGGIYGFFFGLGGVKNQAGKRENFFSPQGYVDTPCCIKYGTYVKGVSVSIFGMTETFNRGLIINGLSGYSYSTAGVQISGLINSQYSFKGMMIAGLSNKTRKGTGIQAGLINNCESGRLIQIGLFNRIGKRVTPFINFSLKKKNSIGKHPEFLSNLQSVDAEINLP